MSAIVSAVQEALGRYDPIRVTKSHIEVIPKDGKVTLSGHVLTVAIKQMAAYLAAGVTGVEEVENSLVADSEIEQAVAWALATDERTRLTTERIQINALLGHVMLKGPVLSEGVVLAAAVIVRAVAGVTDVTNRLEVSKALQAEMEARERAKREAEEAAALAEAAAKAAAEAAAAAKKAAAVAAAIPATDLPGWALKAKADWSKEEFKAFAMAKRAAKKGDAPPVEELLAAGERARAGVADQAVAAEPAKSAAATDLPAWATKPKSDWAKEDFRAYAKAKREAKQSGEELPPIPEA